MILLRSYVYYTTDTLDTIEAFIAETYVQLAATVLYDGLNSCSCRCWLERYLLGPFNLAKISKKLRIKWNFELTMFELSVPDL